MVQVDAPSPSLRDGIRINVFLPVNSIRERRAAARVVALVRELFSGYTQTLSRPAVLRGYWVEGATVYVDNISLLVVDVEAPSVEDPSVAGRLPSIRTRVFDAYRLMDSPQQEVWITTQQIGIYR
jgi:hypothetical protein